MTRYLVHIGMIVILGSGMTRADETTNRMSAARELMRAYKNAEALTAFTNLVAMGLNDADNSEALESAAYCAFRQRHTDQAMTPLAMELAKQIPLKGPSIKCQMLLMLENAQNGELIKQFKDENLAALPDDIAPESFYMRGRAYASLKKGQEAEADFKMALERRPREQKYLMALGGNYFSNLKETQKALDTYQRVIQSAAKPHHAVDAILEVARIHISNAKYSEALVVLDNCKDLTAFSDYQRIQVLRTFGQAYAGLGREEEAIASFRDANRPAGTIAPAMSMAIAGIVSGANGTDDDGRLFAGTAKADITYAAGSVRGDKTIAAEDIKDRLYARVVVLQDQAVSVAIVSADMIFFPSARVVREAKEKWNVSHVVLCGTHTHSGGYPSGGCTKLHPEGTANAQWTRMGDPAEILNLEFPEDAWYRETEDKVIAAIGEAKRNLFPARIAAARGPFESAYMAHNRRLVKEDGRVDMLWANPARIPTQPVDPTLGVIRIDDHSGRPRALLVNYACHAVTLMGAGFISADFPGVMCDYVEEELGDQCMAMFIQGAEGDMDPFEMSLRGEHGLNIARQAGISLGKGALRLARDLKSERTDKGSLKMKERVLSLGHRNDPTKTSNVGILTVVINNEIALVTIPGEPFIQHQLDLRAKSPLPHTFLLGLAYAGAGTPFAIYIPTAQAIKEGGYGAVEASFLEAEAGAKMVDEGVASIKELTGSDRN